MSDLWNEIEDDIRQERYDRLWKRYGKIAVGISMLVVLATTGAVLEQHHRQAAAMAETTKFMAGVDDMNAGNYKAAIAVFSDLAKNPSSNYYGPAMLRKAETEAASGDKTAAAKTYAQLSGHDAEFGALAALLAPESADNMPVPDRNSAFYFTQSEQKGWRLLKLGKKPEAVAIFLSLRDDTQAPFTQRSRMQEVLEYLAPEKAAIHD